MSPPRTTTIADITLSMDEVGRVNISEVAGFCRNGNKSPHEWARTARARKLFRILASQRGMNREDMWSVQGGRRGACTWVAPEIAEAYIEDMDAGRNSPKSLMREIEDLKERVRELEIELYGDDGS